MLITFPSSRGSSQHDSAVELAFQIPQFVSLFQRSQGFSVWESAFLNKAAYRSTLMHPRWGLFWLSKQDWGPADCHLYLSGFEGSTSSQPLSLIL